MVEDALSQPDDGVHTTKGFIHEVAGGWWGRVRSERGDTKLSWMWFEPAANGVAMTIAGRGFGEGGADASRWQTDLVSIDAQLPEPTVHYCWEGRSPRQSDLLFGGTSRFQFKVSTNGRVVQGSGEFKDVCTNKALTSTTKVVVLQRATIEESAIMEEGNDEQKRRALAE